MAVALAAAGQAREAGVKAASGSVEGTVVGVDGRALAGARVGVIGRSEIASTSADGRFRLTNVPVGRHTLRAELDGHGRSERAVTVQPGASAAVELALPFLPFSETIVVSAARSEQRQRDTPTEVTVLARSDLERTPAAALDEALKQVPSFSLFRRTSSLVSHPTSQGVSLRGVGASGTSRSLVLLDGVPCNDAFGNWVYWDSVPQLQVESVEVAPSGLSQLYGSSAMAGVINVVTRPPQRRTIALQAYGGSHGSVDAEAFASHVAGRLAASVGASKFRTDGYVLVRAEERGAVDVAATSRHTTGNWRLEYSPSSSFTLFQTGRLFSEERENGTPLTNNSTTETYLGGGLRAVTGRGVWQANVFGHNNAFASTFSTVAPNRSAESLSLAQAVDYHDVGANAQWAGRIGSSHSLAVGSDARFIQADDTEDVYVPPGLNIRDRRVLAGQAYLGGYLQDVITPGWRMVLALGLRVDQWRNQDASLSETANASGSTTVSAFPDTAKTRLTPRLGLLFRLNNEVALRGSVYGGFRAPSLNELFRPFRVGNVLTIANPELGPEHLLGGELGLNHLPCSKLAWRATAFWDRLEDPIANVTVSSTAALITRQRQNLGQARIRGVSVEADAQPGSHVRLRASYVFSDARVVAFAASPELQGNLLPQVPRHRASLGLDCLSPRLLDASLRGRYESRRYDDDQNRLALDGRFVMDLTLGRSLGTAWTIFLSVENLFGASYPVQATPVVLQGAPFTATVGVRFAPRPRGR